MFGLMAGCFKWLTAKEEYYVLIVGLDNSGKTTMLEKIKEVFTGVKGMPPEKITKTVGQNVGRADIGRSKVTFWDLGGLRSIWDRYYADTNGVIFVVDSTDAAQLDTARSLLESMLSEKQLRTCPFLVFANKQDSPTSLSAGEISQRLTIAELTKSTAASGASASTMGHPNRVHFHHGSAVTGAGIREGVEWLVKRIKEMQASRTA